MKYRGLRVFSIAFCLTAAVLAPLVYGVYLLMQWQSQSLEQEVTQSQSGIPITLPSEAHCITILTCIVGTDATSFGLLRLDAVENCIYYAALPSEGVLVNGNDTPTLAQSYAAAGPARVAQLLESTLSIEIDHYLAISETRLPDLTTAFGSVRVGLSGALPTTTLDLLAVDGTVTAWTTTQMQTFLALFQEKITPSQTDFTPELLANIRNTFWESWLRDKLSALPTALPDALRSISASILSDLSATDLYLLDETLSFLADGQAQVVPIPLVGDWNRSAELYQFTDETLLAYAIFRDDDAL